MRLERPSNQHKFVFYYSLSSSLTKQSNVIPVVVNCLVRCAVETRVIYSDKIEQSFTRAKSSCVRTIEGLLLRDNVALFCFSSVE